MYLLSRGSGFPVLFIHGIPTSSHLWNSVVDKLLGRFTCLAVDLPGLGRSPKDRGGVNQLGVNHLQALADRIERIREEHKIDKWHVVGHDAGSAVAVHYAYRFQERVDHLALLSPAVFPELKPFHLFRIIRTPVIGELLAPVVNSIFWNIAIKSARTGEVSAAATLVSGVPASTHLRSCYRHAAPRTGRRAREWPNRRFSS